MKIVQKAYLKSAKFTSSATSMIISWWHTLSIIKFTFRSPLFVTNQSTANFSKLLVFSVQFLLLFTRQKVRALIVRRAGSGGRRREIQNSTWKYKNHNVIPRNARTTSKLKICHLLIHTYIKIFIFGLKDHPLEGSFSQSCNLRIFFTPMTPSKNGRSGPILKIFH